MKAKRHKTRAGCTKETQRCGINIYKLCDCKGYTYDINLCIGKDANPSMTASHAVATRLSAKLEKWDTDCAWTVFLSALLFDDLHTETLTAVGLLDLIEKRCQRIFDRKLN